MRQLISFACLLLPLTLTAQTPPSTSESTSEANAEANASANSSSNSSDSKSKKSSSSQTVTHRKVVVNGKTVVDEKKVNNKPAKGSLPGGSLDIDKMKDEMMRKLQEQLKNQLKDHKGITIRPPLRVTTDLPGKGKGLRDVLRPNKPVVPVINPPKPQKSKESQKSKASTKSKRTKLVPRKGKTSTSKGQLR